MIEQVSPQPPLLPNSNTLPKLLHRLETVMMPRETDEARRNGLVMKINKLEPSYRELTDEQLLGKTNEFRTIYQGKTQELTAALKTLQAELHTVTDQRKRQELELKYAQLRQKAYGQEQAVLNELLPEAFATVREATDRVLGLRQYDEQLLTGIVLHEGNIAEMATGEGKTFAAPLSLYLNAITGKAVHLATPNDYLSKVGAGWMGGVFLRLGMRTAVVTNGFAGVYDPLYTTDKPDLDDRLNHFLPVKKGEAYRADIVYGSSNELGFDYLRDNMVRNKKGKVQREPYYAALDEADAILIDEARVPLVISEKIGESMGYAKLFSGRISQLQPDRDYEVNDRLQTASLTEEGMRQLEAEFSLPTGSLFATENMWMSHYIANALRAHAIVRRDKDYVVQDGEIVIVDQQTHRQSKGRRFSGGLHEALEAKEGLQVKPESRTRASVTLQNYFRRYEKRAGMTGTAEQERAEFIDVYGMEVVPIPTHHPSIRQDLEETVYGPAGAKWDAVVAEIDEMHKLGRPVLIGTTSLEESEHVASLLRRKGILHKVLNAKNQQQEAHLIAQAGRSGAVTVSTNMAGRGVDILLGGNPDGIARARIFSRNQIRDGNAVSDWNEELQKAKLETERDAEKVRKAGGLHVIGTGLHESLRIDDQLRGRAGRQGDPGSTHFILSLEDEILVKTGAKEIVESDSEPLESRRYLKQMEHAQSVIDGNNRSARRNLLAYDDVLTRQREAIYRARDNAMESPVDKLITQWFGEEVDVVVKDAVKTAVRSKKVPDLAEVIRFVRETTGDVLGINSTGIKPKELPEFIRERVVKDILLKKYEENRAKIEAKFGPGTAAQLESAVLLDSIDRHWETHLLELEDMLTGISWRSLAQENPLVSYRREASLMYEKLILDIKGHTTRVIFTAQTQVLT